MLYQEQGFGGVGGVRGHFNKLECIAVQLMGRLEGNKFHGCGLFGTYVLAGEWPKKTEKTLDRNGLPILAEYKAWASTGEDNG